MKKILLLGGAVVIIILIVLVVNRGDSTSKTSPAVGIALAEGEDILDLTLGFYNEWLQAAQDPEVDPYTSSVIDTLLLSATTTEYISTASREQNGEPFDPVLCQATTPERVGGRILYELEDEAQVMVLSRGEDSHRQQQAIVTLAANEGLWQIISIECATGETAPDREYSFEQNGFLLKNVPAPLDDNFWHLVFEQQGQPGHTVPLFFDENSQCVDTDGISAVCEPDEFIEPSAAIVKGEMQETGLNVQIIELQ